MTFHMLDLRLQNKKREISVHMCTKKKKKKKKKNLNSRARARRVKTIGVRNIKKQEQGVPKSSDETENIIIRGIWK